MAFEGKAPAAIDRQDVVGLLEQQAAQQRAAAGPHGGGEGIRQLHQRAGQDVGDDEVVGHACLQLGVAQADGMDEAAEVADAVQHGVFARDLDGLGIVVAADHRPLPQLGHGDGQDAAAAADIDGVGRLGRDRASPAFPGSRASWRACRCRRPCRHRCAAAAGRPACHRHCARDEPRRGRRRTAGTSAGSRPPSRCRAASPSSTTARPAERARAVADCLGDLPILGLAEHLDAPRPVARDLAARRPRSRLRSGALPARFPKRRARRRGR